MSPEYFLNLKNSILLKTNNRNASNNNLNSIHSSVLNLKKKSKNVFSKGTASGNYSNNYDQQYQLQFNLKNDANNNFNSPIILTNSYGYSVNNSNMLVNIKNPLFLNMIYEDVDSIGVDLFELYVQKMHVDGDFGFVQLYEVSNLSI